MADWQRILDVKDVWASNDQQTIAIEIVAKLTEMKPFGFPHIDDAKLAIIAEMSEIAKYTELDVDDFDEVMEMLYDWGDITLPGISLWNAKKVCWIQTF